MCCPKYNAVSLAGAQTRTARSRDERTKRSLILRRPRSFAAPLSERERERGAANITLGRLRIRLTKTSLRENWGKVIILQMKSYPYQRLCIRNRSRDKKAAWEWLTNSLVFMCKYHNQFLPSVFDSFFTKVDQVHSYNTRHASKLSYYLPKVRTNYGKFNVRFQGPMTWNSIDEDFKSSSLSSFKVIPLKLFYQTFFETWHS